MSGSGAPAIRRHPSEATLVAHAAGTLWAAAKPVVQGHLDLCEHCRVAFGLADRKRCMAHTQTRVATLL